MKCDICGHEMKYDPLTRSWECGVCFNLDKKSSEVEHPKHYTSGKVEAIDAIESAVIGLEPFEAFCIGNAIKYLYRYKKKGESDKWKEDLRKSIFYINKILEE